jgi:hypothetical protein
MQAASLPQEVQEEMRVFIGTALQSRQRPVSLDTQDGGAALARMLAEACEAGMFE